MTKQPLSQAALEAFYLQNYGRIGSSDLSGLSQEAKDETFSYFMRENFKKRGYGAKLGLRGGLGDISFNGWSVNICNAYKQGISPSVILGVALEVFPTVWENKKSSERDTTDLWMAYSGLDILLRFYAADPEKLELTRFAETVTEQLKEHYLQEGKPEKAVFALSCAFNHFGTNADSLISLVEEKKIGDFGVLASNLRSYEVKEGVSKTLKDAEADKKYYGSTLPQSIIYAVGGAYLLRGKYSEAFEFYQRKASKISIQGLKRIYSSNKVAFNELFAKQLDKMREYIEFSSRLKPNWAECLDEVHKNEPNLFPAISLGEAAEISRECGDSCLEKILDITQTKRLNEIISKYKDKFQGETSSMPTLELMEELAAGYEHPYNALSPHEALTYGRLSFTKKMPSDLEEKLKKGIAACKDEISNSRAGAVFYTALTSGLFFTSGYLFLNAANLAEKLTQFLLDNAGVNIAGVATIPVLTLAALSGVGGFYSGLYALGYVDDIKRRSPYKRRRKVVELEKELKAEEILS